MPAHSCCSKDHLPVVTLHGRGPHSGHGAGDARRVRGRRGRPGQQSHRRAFKRASTPLGMANPRSVHSSRSQSPDLRSFQIKLEIWGLG